MPRLIFKCPHIRSGGGKAAHLKNLVRYIATRDGVEQIALFHGDLPATAKQTDAVEKLLKEFPLSRALFEYEDYTRAPTQEHASAFITRALEDNMDWAAKRGNYVDYIAQRPRVQKRGAHGLFTGSEQSVVLSRVAEEVANHPGTVWLPIISLRREDAARLGYDNAERWRQLLSSQAPEIARAMKIPQDQFRWYAAYHDEGYHPHVHMVCYSADGKSGFLTKQGISQIRSGLAREIFRYDLTEIYQRQTQQRGELTQEVGEALERTIDQMRNGTLENRRIERLMAELARRLQTVSGKKQYGYLKAPLKAVVDEIVDELARDQRVAAAYDLWYELREEVLRTYRDDIPERLPLSRQKEFKRIRNIVIQEALGLNDPPSPGSDKTGDAPSQGRPLSVTYDTPWQADVPSISRG